jgi:hypothetical protein
LGLNSGPIPWATPPALFCERFFPDRVSMNFLPGVGFEPWCSWPLPPEQLRLKVWATGTSLTLIFILVLRTSLSVREAWDSHLTILFYIHKIKFKGLQKKSFIKISLKPLIIYMLL